MSTKMGISCQRNGHQAATNHLSCRGLMQPLSSVAGRCAGRCCALIRQLANYLMYGTTSIWHVVAVSYQYILHIFCLSKATEHNTWYNSEVWSTQYSVTWKSSSTLSMLTPINLALTSKAPELSVELISNKTFLNLEHAHTHTQVFIRLWGSRKPHLATCSTLQLPATSQHHSPTWILPHNHTNIRIHAHTTPTHTDL